MSNVDLRHGDCLAVMRELPDNSVDAVVTDPPYNLSFMGREWDTFGGKRDEGQRGGTGDKGILPGYGRGGTNADVVKFRNASALAFQEWCEQWASECLRVLKPGGYLLSFGGTRTWHRLACAIEDSGFEIRDSISWNYGSGFPKSRNVTKDLESMPRCTCNVSDDGSVVKSALPARPVGAGVGAEPGPVPLAGESADEAGGVGPQVLAATAERLTDVDALDVDGIGEGLPVVLGPLRVAPVAQREQVVGGVGDVEVNPEALGDEVMGDEVVDHSAVLAGPVSRDDRSRDGGPLPTLVFPLPTAPGGVVSSGHSLAVGSGHAGPGAVDAGVGPTAEFVAANGADVDSVAGTLHGSNSTAERLGRCEVCGGLRGTIPQGLGTSLKPGFEPCVVARKPLVGTVAQNVQQFGTGALNVDGCRIGDGSESQGARSLSEASAETRYTDAGAVNFAATPGPRGGSPAGRWPANVCLSSDQAAALDQMSGTLTSGTWNGKRNGTKTTGTYGAFVGEDEPPREGSSGGASRFFLTAEPDAPDLPIDELAERFMYCAKAPKSERPVVNGVAHNTVKPVSLMKWLVRLCTPPGGTILEPFAGSGTTVEAAILEGFDIIAIEREADYLQLIQARIFRAQAKVAAAEESVEPPKKAKGRWPANVALDEESAEALDLQSGKQKDGVAVNRNRDPDADKKAAIYGRYRNGTTEDATYGGGGGASRYFFVAKSEPTPTEPEVWRDGAQQPDLFDDDEGAA